jgi:hypothetical protein
MLITADIDAYLQHFTWEEAKYPVRNSLKELIDKIHIVCPSYYPSLPFLHAFHVSITA